MYEKEGQLNGSVGAVIQLITGVGVAVLVLIFVGTLGGQSYQLTESKVDSLVHSVTNESVTIANGAGQTAYSNVYEVLHFGNSTLQCNPANVACVNFTSTGIISANSSFVNGTYDISYGYGSESIRAAIKNSAISGFSALKQTGDLLPLIVVAVVIVLVMSLILFLNTGQAGKGGTSAL